MKDENQNFEPEKAITIPIGKNCTGETVFKDLFSLGNILIGGDNRFLTKYVSSLITSLSERYSDEELEIILNSNERKIFSRFKGNCHFWGGKVKTRTPEILDVAEVLYRIYRERYKLLESFGGSFFEYNKIAKRKLPVIVSITSDYSKLLGRKGNHFFFHQLINKALYSKGTGVFLIVATSNYSIEPSCIRDGWNAYFPTRLEFYQRIYNASKSVLQNMKDQIRPLKDDVILQTKDDLQKFRIL
ncbi:hypothetical protein P3B99_008725 [Opitutia bacterium KCR 482]|nr:hypothetical protein [Opitutae bacterium KCR 482]